MLRVKDEKRLSSKRKKKLLHMKETHKAINRFFSRNFTGQKEVIQYSYNNERLKKKKRITTKDILPKKLIIQN